MKMKSTIRKSVSYLVLMALLLVTVQTVPKVVKADTAVTVHITQQEGT